MHVDFGSRRTIVISSPELAKEVLMKNDLNLSGRFKAYTNEAMNHHEFSMGALPVGTRWRMFRRVCREHIFTAQRLEVTEELRQQKLRDMRDYLEECSRCGTAVDIGEAMMVTSLNMLSNTIVSMDFAAYGSTASREIRESISKAMLIGGTANVADYFPFLKRFDPNGLQRKTRVYYSKILEYLDDIISKRIKLNQSPPSFSTKKSNDLLQVLLDLTQKNELTLEEVRHLLLDLFIIGGDSTSLVLLWVMAELLHDPNKMTKAKHELRAVVGDEREALESDIPKLPYLSAMIKETFIYRPGTPFLVPHKAEVDVEINGYTIPKGAAVLINIWAISRDPRVWANPNSFDPERFLDKSIDYRGQSFELIPFGAGRRLCPAVPLAHLMSHLLVAHMVHSFDWKFMEGMRPNMDNQDMGLAVRMATPLKAIPVKKK